MKIISLVPSITELLFDLGLKDQLIGRTKFCIHPMPEVKEIPQFGGTKGLHIDKIIAAKPSLIIANREENLKSEVEELQKHCDVLITDVATLEENNEMILQIGKRTHTYAQAELIVEEINENFGELETIFEPSSVLYFIWKDPYMSIGKDTFIHEMIQLSGFKNVCEEESRYPEITKDSNLNPDYIFLSSEPYPFQEKHIEEINKLFPNAKCVLVDGEMFSWYGSRMRLAPAYFKDLRKKIKALNKGI
ncbi:helical backbone metal receptor [Weeksellaceae bacterium KMM 9724]|uniref:ABC transporter substrate-binding protein n=1 Tax=Profundicola chukchiensis TaxID=2961959 RepID=UPI002439EDE6|nr:helical backbone metal receptor [Profundicola chukchiensis]MDG4950497.1 helical backbone metal receptor [Profundicola chukchiensis]